MSDIQHSDAQPVGSATAHTASESQPFVRPAPNLTHVELLYQEAKIERWIRFGYPAQDRIVDGWRRVVSFAPGSIFAFVRWQSNDFGTVLSRIDILRALEAHEAMTTIGFLRPGGEILLRMSGWPKVQRVLQLIDTLEQDGFDPATICPDHWRHIHNRLSANQEPRDYTRERHTTWLARKDLLP
ncbi:MAG: DUF2840 domain-containing protein [Acidobacteria bacterium]|jgi:hypothetical protein|nr:DUF2840 domain-containing protein [Acidobacteriota bacterium]